MMLSTNNWLRIVCAMQANAVLFGIGAIIVLTHPQLKAEGMFWMPVVVVLSFVLSPFVAWFIAPRLRARYWRSIGRNGDLISG